MLEFALTLPLLVFFVVGIFDFSNAFTFKQKLTNVARDAARVAASDPSNDLQYPSTAAPASVIDAYQVIDYYLQANNINDCGIAPPAAPSGKMTWTATGTSAACPPGGLTIIINRGYYFPATAASLPVTSCTTPQSTGGQTAVIATCINIQYGYQWKFGRVASLLGSTTVLPTSISVAGVAMNEN